MSVSELKEFVGETREDAVAQAAQFFGVGRDRIEVRVLSDHLPISGLGDRVLILGSLRDEEEAEQGEIGPVGEFLRGLFERMQLPGPVRIGERREEDRLLLTLRGDAIRELTRREARLVGSLAHLASRAAERLGERASVEIEVADARGRGGGRGGRDRGRERRSEGRGNGRGGRRGRGGDDSRGGRGPRAARSERGSVSDPRPGDERLEALARERGEEVRRTGEPVELSPMGSRDRWVVHQALKEVGGVRSESVGDSRQKRVRILPDEGERMTQAPGARPGAD